MGSLDERRRRCLRILIAGTGGQGSILAARLLTGFFVDRGHRVVSGQLHGMAQRGGAVQATVMIDCGQSPAIPLGGADFVIGLEPVETARALPYISRKTTVCMNTTPIIPFALAQEQVLGTGPGVYPDIAELGRIIRAVTPGLLPVDATELATRAGSIKTANVVMLGCLFGSAAFPYEAEDFIDTVMRTAPPALVEVNTRAFRAGVALSRQAASQQAAPPGAAGGASSDGAQGGRTQGGRTQPHAWVEETP